MSVNLYNGTTTGFTNYHAAGIELEHHGVGVTSTNAQMSRDGVQGVRNKRDASHNVDCESVLPPLPACERADDYIQQVLRSIRAAGGDGYIGTGMHVHVSNAEIVGVTDEASANAFATRSIEHTERTGRVIFQDHPELLADPMPCNELGDFLSRYTNQQIDINGMQPVSRTNNSMCQALELRRVTRAIRDTADQADVSALRAATHGKFSTINLQPWTTIKTVEFRQAIGTVDHDKCVAWTAFLLNLVNYTRTERFAGTMTTEDRATPPHGRDVFAPQAHRITHVYDMMRTAGGATCREIMMRTGVSETSTRRMASEIRSRVGDSAVITHTQQSQNSSYGDGTDLLAWEVPTSYTVEVEGPKTLQENVNPSIWGGMSEDHFGWWIARMDHLERA